MTTESVSVKIAPADKRCRFWAKIIRHGVTLPIPANVERASDVPGGFAKLGEDELLPGEFVIEGEENHHRKARGWTYRLGYIENGEFKYMRPGADEKAALKAAGMDYNLLRGSGDLAAVVRMAHGMRLGLWPVVTGTDTPIPGDDGLVLDATE